MRKQRYLESEKLSIAFFGFLFLMYAVVYMTKTMFSSAMASIVEEGFMTKSQTGLINAAFWFAYAPFQVIGGFAADKYSPYKLVMIGLVGALVSNIVIYFNQSYYVMLSAWVFNAIIQFGMWPGVFKIISTQLAKDLRSKAVFWMLFSTSLGFGISMLVASFVKRWQHNFLVSVISLAVVIVAYTIINHFIDKKMVETEIAYEKKPGKEQGEKSAMLPLLFSSGLAIFLVLCSLRGAIDNGIKMMTPVMLMESYNSLPAAISTRISSILIVFSAFGVFISGLVQKRVTKNESVAQIILYSISLIPIAVVCFIGKIHYIWVLLALCVGVMLLHSAAPFSQSFVAMYFEKHGRIGTVSGMLNAAGSIGNVLASYVFAKMAELMPWRGVAASWLIVVVVCIVLCAAVMRRWARFKEEAR